jgi:hypothetical protein
MMPRHFADYATAPLLPPRCFTPPLFADTSAITPKCCYFFFSFRADFEFFAAALLTPLRHFLAFR